MRDGKDIKLSLGRYPIVSLMAACPTNLFSYLTNADLT